MNKHSKTNKGRKLPKSWVCGCYRPRKSYNKSRFIRERKRYFIRGVIEWAYPKYLTMDEIVKGYYDICENRKCHLKGA